MKVPILKQADYLVVSIPSLGSGSDLAQLRKDISLDVARNRPKGVIFDVTELDVMDAFSTRTVRELAQVFRLRGVETMVAGIHPDVALGMAQVGLELDDIPTALDVDEGIALLRQFTLQSAK